MTDQTRKNLRHWIAGAALLMSFLFPAAVHGEFSSGLSVHALDTVAGFETAVKGSGASPREILHFTILAPDGSSFDVSTLASDNGLFEAVIPGEKTTRAGVYRVEDLATFEVFAAEMSPEASSLTESKHRVNVKITDRFGNPLEFHDVQLSSSSPSVQITEIQSETDESGTASFSVSSKTDGFASFTATDESALQQVSQKLSMSFGAPSVPGETKNAAHFTPTYARLGFDKLSLGLAPPSFGRTRSGPTRPELVRQLAANVFGGDPEPVLLAQAQVQASSLTARFLIENVPASIPAQEATSFTVKGVDSSGKVVPSFAGTVVFSSTDSNAKLPRAYTFQTSDQGIKTFDLLLSFGTAGTQKLTVQDQSNALIKGEKTIEVMRASADATGTVRITRPATGTYSMNVMKVEGESDAFSRVQIFDKGQQIGEVQSNGTGRFEFTTSLLQDGEHVFHATSNGQASPQVKVTIDSTPASIEMVEIEKPRIAPGDTTNVLIRSDPDLSAVQATVGESIIDLEADPQNPGVYRGLMKAPTELGEHTVNVILTDRSGNTSQAIEIGTLIVDASLTPEASVGFEVPSKVQGVIAEPGDAFVNLQWQPATAATGMAFYRIYYGTNSGKLSSIEDTVNAMPAWDVENLRNGSTYFFQVVGVDTEGSEGDNRSNVVSAVPQAGLTLPLGQGQEDAESYQNGGNGSGNGNGNGNGSGSGRNRDGSGGLYGDGSRNGAYGDGFGSDDGSGGLYDDVPPVLCDPSPCPPDIGYPPGTPDDGPEVLGMVLAAILGGAGWRMRRKVT